MHSFIHSLPKAELHSHIEGTMEPELILKLADRNKIKLPYSDEDALRRAYQFQDLQSFLNLYFMCANTLRKPEDFYDMTLEYLKRCQQDGVIHTEIFVEFQSYRQNNIAIEVILEGISAAIKQGAKEYGVTCYIILCFLRHRPPMEAMQTLDHAVPYLDQIVGVGLAAAERPYPPHLFKEVYDKAHSLGLKRVAHAGEEGPADYVWQALELLGVDRIDHGVRCAEDPKLVERLIETQTPLTVCPLSNVKLRVFPDMASHNVYKLFKAGVNVTINADDPSFFGGYVTENYQAIVEAHPFTKADIIQLAKNGIQASFLPTPQKASWLKKIETYR